MAKTKKSRLRRGKTRPIELTERDKVILLSLYKYRFLLTDHLQALTDTESRWGMNKRLRLLYDNKYIDKPKAQLALFSHAEKRPTIYALGNKGADTLAHQFHIPMPESVYWTEKNRRVREKHIEHTLGISDFMVSVEMVCKQAGNIRLMDRDEILARSPTQTKRAKNPERWKTEIRHDGQVHEIAIVPDYMFGLHYEDKPEGRNRAFFFVEIDRGTMPIIRRDIKQTSFLRKMQSYADSWERQLPKTRYNIKAFRVLTLTTSHDRIQTMLEAYKTEIKAQVPAGVFLFAVKTGDLNAKRVWVNATGKQVDMI
ncbi:MAG TPA: hypothetical protein ENJ42_06210 [Hellea balneolensis]|uniref:Replication-relaxation n=1 Tax=Hellea balneolensis TaxID=287478 RepID=A0A7C5M0A4_9PROT|nr:hypothetical protein [Hellea balneolensis]